jgi:hypothetical protein
VPLRSAALAVHLHDLRQVLVLLADLVPRIDVILILLVPATLVRELVQDPDFGELLTTSDGAPFDAMGILGTSRVFRAKTCQSADGSSTKKLRIARETHTALGAPGHYDATL